MEEIIILNSEDRLDLMRLFYQFQRRKDSEYLFRLMERVLTDEEYENLTTTIQAMEGERNDSNDKS